MVTGNGQVFTLSKAGYLVRSWSAADGTLLWEVSLPEVVGLSLSSATQFQITDLALDLSRSGVLVVLGLNCIVALGIDGVLQWSHIPAPSVLISQLVPPSPFSSTQSTTKGRVAVGCKTTNEGSCMDSVVLGVEWTTGIVTLLEYPPLSTTFDILPHTVSAALHPSPPSGRGKPSAQRALASDLLLGWSRASLSCPFGGVVTLQLSTSRTASTCLPSPLPSDLSPASKHYYTVDPKISLLSAGADPTAAISYCVAHHLAGEPETVACQAYVFRLRATEDSTQPLSLSVELLAQCAGEGSVLGFDRTLVHARVGTSFFCASQERVDGGTAESASGPSSQSQSSLISRTWELSGGGVREQRLLMPSVVVSAPVRAYVQRYTLSKNGGDGKPSGLRVMIQAAGGEVVMLQEGLTQWSRHEGLARVRQAVMVDRVPNFLPPSQNDDAPEEEDALPSAADRWRMQWEDIQARNTLFAMCMYHHSLPLRLSIGFLAHSPGRLYGTGGDSADRASTTAFFLVRYRVRSSQQPYFISSETSGEGAGGEGVRI